MLRPVRGMPRRRRAAARSAPFGPILVLDGHERMSLGVCRTLGRHGFDIGVAGHQPDADLARRSRYARRYDTLPDRQGPAAPYEEALRELVARDGYAAIVPTHDVTLARLASIDLPAPTPSRLDEAWHRLQDKVELAAVCAEVGATYPETLALPDEASVAPALEQLGLPAFVKSIRSALATPERVAFARGGRWVRDVDDAKRALASLQERGLPAVAQRGVEKTAKYVGVLLRRDGGTELRYATEVLREHPRSGGLGITLRALAPDSPDAAAILGLLERVCEAVGYEGIVQAEFYRRRGDGELVVLDVNPRLWGSTWFAERLGVRVVERSLRAALGLPALPPPAYEAGRTFHTADAELSWILAAPDRARTALAYLRSLRPSDHFEWIDGTDPRPTLAFLAQTLRHRRERSA